jgi:hypothetical protein
VHDPGKVLLDIALATALGGDCLPDVAMLRAETDVFGPVASDPTVSRLVDALAAAGPKPLTAIRTARAEVRTRVWELAGTNGPAADDNVTVDIDGVLVLAHSDKQDATATRKKTLSSCAHRWSSTTRCGPAARDSRTSSRCGWGSRCSRPRRRRRRSRGGGVQGCARAYALDQVGVGECHRAHP